MPLPLKEITDADAISGKTTSSAHNRLMTRSMASANIVFCKAVTQIPGQVDGNSQRAAYIETRNTALTCGVRLIGFEGVRRAFGSGQCRLLLKLCGFIPAPVTLAGRSVVN